MESNKSRLFRNIPRKFLWIAGVLLSFISCREEAIYTPEERFVLQAYLYANEPVWDITVKNAVPLTVSDSVGEPINNAVITLYKNSLAYNLVSSGDSGTYYYPGTDLTVETGDEFEIEATVGEKTATAKTSVPNSPQGVIMSADKIELPEINVDAVSSGFDFTAMRAFREAQQSVELEVLWDNPNGDLYFVVIENSEDTQESIFPTLAGNFERLGGKGAFRKISPPTRESSFQINFMDIQYWGKYLVKVYRVNQEYADLYENLEQDSRDLNEPPTNIKNGLGIFSAFHSQNVYFEVVKQ